MNTNDETVMLLDGRTIYRRDPARDGIGEIRERAADGSSGAFARTHGNVVAMLDTIRSLQRQVSAQGQRVDELETALQAHGVHGAGRATMSPPYPPCDCGYHDVLWNTRHASTPCAPVAGQEEKNV